MSSKARRVKSEDLPRPVIAFYCIVSVIIFYCCSFLIESNSTLETYVVERIKVDYADQISEIDIETVFEEKSPKSGFQIDANLMALSANHIVYIMLHDSCVISKTRLREMHIY